MASLKKAATILEMIKFEHTVFALPFAYIGMVLGAEGLPGFAVFFWITIAMVGARSFAMSLNRLFDLDIDKKNPRTAGWPLSAGFVTVGETIILSLTSLSVFLISVYMLPPLCHKLWPAVLLPMSFYSLTKRFTCLCHFFLGLCLGLAPLGAWVAATNTLPVPGIYALGLAVMFWTAGFDIIYSCQDHGFDQQEGLHSIPVRIGIKKALILTRIFHGLAVFFLLLFGNCFSFGAVYYMGIALIAVFLYYENWLLSPKDLSKINMSFFTLNGFVSIFAFILTFMSIYLQ